MNKKIIWIVGGPNPIYINIFEELKKQDNELDLIMVMNNIQKDTFTNKYFKPVFLRKINLGKYFFFPIYIKNKLFNKSNVDIIELTYFDKLNDLLKKEKPDLVIALTYFKPYTRQAYNYCKKNNVPLIIQPEIKQIPKGLLSEIYTRLSLIYSKNLFKYCSKILPWTDDAYNFAKKYMDKNKIKLLTPGIKTNIFKNHDTKKTKNIFKILMVARMVPFKRYNDALSAIKYLKENFPVKFKLTILGDGPLKNEIKELIKILDLKNDVYFHKKIKYKKMNEIYSKHDVLILPSYNEAIGMVVPEAMSCGLPAIVSNTCGCKTYISNNVDGLIFTTFDYNELATKLFLLSFPQIQKIFSKNASKKIHNNYDIKIIGNSLYNVIKDVIIQKT